MCIIRRFKESLITRRPALLRTAVVLVVALVAAMPFVNAAPAMAQSVSISASTATPGTDVTISGTGFTDGDQYQITFAPGTAFEQVLVPLTTISGTSFSELVTAPQVPNAQYSIRISTNRGNFSVSLSITPILELNINTGAVGDTLLASGGGFRASRAINIYFNNSLIAQTTTTLSGVMNPVSFQVPAIRTGNYNIYATDGIVSSPAVVFSVRPYLTSSVNQGFVGDQIKLDGTGFDDNSGIRIYWDGQLLSTSSIFTNATGTFTANIAVPATTRGAHTIQARDNLSGTSTTSFVVNSKIVLNPSSGASGTPVAISGSGFRSNASVTITYSGATITTQPVNVFTNATGSFSATFTAPNVIAGNYSIRASDGIYTASADFLIASEINLSATTGAVGSELLVTGTGFTPRGRVSISFDSLILITITADPSGAFSVSFTVPASGAGQHSVTARDLTTGGITASATFSIESTPPPVPTLLMPQQNTQASVQPMFEWSAVSDPSGVTYSLQVASDAGFSQLIIFKQGLMPPEYQVQEAEQLQLTKISSPYYWRVRAVDGAGNTSAWTAAGAFYTQDSTPPAVPALNSPPNDSQTELMPLFSWSAVSDPSGVTYSLQVATDAGFSQLALSKTGLTQTDYQVTAPDELTLTKRTAPYYWRVRAVDGAANASNWTGARMFYTEDSAAPPAPVPLSPENGSRKSSHPRFTWTSVTDPSGVTYTLEAAQDSAFTHLVIFKDGLTDTEYQLAESEELSPTTGKPEAPYYWRVRATDGAQNQSDWSTANSFYVGGFFQQNGWAIWVLGAIGGLLLLGIGVYIGVKIRPSHSA